ncbi:carbon-nitrogen hydrolase family protein [Cryptosporangium sp. NPDC048952]|uniref:carbon-nitrogen hydrolase family protein n=1 Tax=Cryptosporangium sp. NPDC048952 TaxID=3363961 RepID=UPI00371F685A
MLVLAVAQPLVTSFDVAANAVAHAEAVRAARARVVVFPEMSLTGYEFTADPLSPDDARLTPLIAACADTGSIALAGAPVGGAGRSIGMLVVDGGGVRVGYRKQYLGGGEPAVFVPGTGPVVIEVDGWRLGLAICKDTGVEQHAADTAALGMDVYVAGVLEHASDFGVPAERAVRIAAAHGVPVAIASFAGSSGEGFERAAGGSGVWAADGAVLARAGTLPGELVTAGLTRNDVE